MKLGSCLRAGLVLSVPLLILFGCQQGMQTPQRQSIDVTVFEPPDDSRFLLQEKFTEKEAIALLQNPDPRVRMETVHRIQKMAENPVLAVDCLILALDDDLLEFQLAAARAIWSFGPSSREAIPALQSTLNRALHKMGEVKPIDATARDLALTIIRIFEDLGPKATVAILSLIRAWQSDPNIELGLSNAAWRAIRGMGKPAIRPLSYVIEEALGRAIDTIQTGRWETDWEIWNYWDSAMIYCGVLDALATIAEDLEREVSTKRLLIWNMHWGF